MQKILVVVDMQNDFIDGALGTNEARTIVDKVKNKIQSFEGKVYYTRDTHSEDYMDTQEGRKLPVVHCVKDTHGWEIYDALCDLKCDGIFDKPTFGSISLAQRLVEDDKIEKIQEITFIGICTDICVISNAMLARAALPDTEITVDSACCAGVTPASHNTALSAMKSCQINIL